ncbi:MAG: 4-hydroxy-3-methylbut-2-enyl diphosphate reductase, partial [Actinobacteria bacterium]|nr:4-hydroxy-3-methylbut-2-enyl diphosphate reductase [Actinomycetota bacterium]
MAGTGGGLAADLAPGDLVVASEVTDGTTTVPCPSAPLLAGELTRAGLPARAGRVITTGRLAGGRERQRLAGSGALVADMESAPLAAAADGRPVAVLRAVSDTPGHPLLGPG